MACPINVPSHLWGEKSQKALDRFLRVLPSLIHSDPKLLELEYLDLAVIVRDEMDEMEGTSQALSAGALT